MTGSSAASRRGPRDKNPFAHYGNITLNVWSADNQDPGPEPVIKALAASFSKKYPNVTVKLKFYGFTTTSRSSSCRSTAATRRTWPRATRATGIDSLLVKAKLIRPLDQYAKKYGWNKYFPPGTAQQFRWTPDGNTYGKGNLWGVAQFGQSTGVFYNKALLKQYGGDPNKMPTTFAGFRSCSRSCARRCPRAYRSSSIGNKGGYESMHASAWCRARTCRRQFMRNWIFHVPGSDLRAACQHQGARRLQQWFKDDYFGNDYNAVGRE